MWRDRTRCRIRHTATLAVVAAGVAVLAGPRRPVIGARQFPADSLPWKSLLVNGATMAPPSEGSFLLYVLPTCSHCDSAAIAFAMAVQRSGAHGLIVAGSGTKEAEEYRRRLDLPAMGTDSAREFARVAGIRVVPTLLRTRNGATVVTPAQSARWVRAQVEKH